MFVLSIQCFFKDYTTFSVADCLCHQHRLYFCKWHGIYFFSFHFRPSLRCVYVQCIPHFRTKKYVPPPAASNISRGNFQSDKPKVIRYEIFATNSSIKRFTCSGLSVLELCPAPSIHVKGIFVLRCHALLYRIHEPA